MVHNLKGLWMDILIYFFIITVMDIVCYFFLVNAVIKHLRENLMFFLAK
jgi:hypothetical protein